EQIVGYVVARDVLALGWERDLLVFDDILRPAYFIDARARGVDVLRELQRRRIQMAIISDEHGGVAGLLTLEDLLEELVGDILGEGDEDESTVEWEADGTAVVVGITQVRRVNRELGLNL